MVSMSKEHLIFLADGTAVAAGSVNIGDHLASGVVGEMKLMKIF